MAFKPGVSGNPAGRPKKLLRRVDEVLFARGLDPAEEVCKVIDELGRARPVKKLPPATLKKADRRTWVAADRARQLAAFKEARLALLLELMPYVYARVKDQPEETGEDLARKPTGELLKLVKEKFPELQEAKA